MNHLMSREECKETLVNILTAVSNICDQYKLRYYLGYGTMLGAVRHKGFIPWDDDIDIYMPREDYNELIRILKTDICQTPWLSIVDMDTEGYYYPFAKAVDNRTLAKMEDNITKHGLWIDIFPIDFTSDNYVFSFIQIMIAGLLRAIIISATTDFSSENLGRKRIVKKILNNLSKKISIRRILNLYNDNSRRYNKNGSSYGANFFSRYYMRERMPIEKLFDGAPIVFENKVFCGIKDYDFYLSHLYGDYKTLPPEDKRKTHSISAYMLNKD